MSVIYASRRDLSCAAIYRFLQPAKNMADLLVQISYIFYQNVTKNKIVAKKLVQKPCAFYILIYLKLTCNRTLIDEYFQTAKNVDARLVQKGAHETCYLCAMSLMVQFHGGSRPLMALVFSTMEI